MTSTVRRFLFEGLDIRGAIVHLGDAWQQMQAGRDYQPTVAQLLGETTAVTALIAAQLKQPGRLTLQLRGNGPVQLLVMDCNEQLQLRGMARSNPVVLPAPVPDLLGVHQGGQLLMSLDLPSARQPAGKGFEQRLTEPGRYDITVLDDSGAYDRISLSVR